MNTEAFDIFDPNGRNPGGAAAPSSSDGGDQRAVRPPQWGVPVLGLEVLLAALCFIPGTRTFHWIGYVVGALVVSATSILYRIDERKRRRSASFVTVPGRSTMVVAAVVVGIALGALHAFYIAQTHSVSPW